MLIFRGEAHRRPVSERDRDRTLHFLLIEIPCGIIEVPLQLLAGLRGRVQDSAASRVAAKQRALRAFQNLYRLQIEKRGGTCASRLEFVEIRKHGGGCVWASFSIEVMTVPELTLGITAPLIAVAVFML